jgi:hypothetical protein
MCRGRRPPSARQRGRRSHQPSLQVKEGGHHRPCREGGGAISRRYADPPLYRVRVAPPWWILEEPTPTPSRHATIGSSRWAIAWPLVTRCGLLHGLSDFKDKGGREENGWIGEKGEDILGEKRLDFRE